MQSVVGEMFRPRSTRERDWERDRFTGGIPHSGSSP